MIALWPGGGFGGFERREEAAGLVGDMDDRDGWEGRLGCSGRPRQWDSGRWLQHHRGARAKPTDLDSDQ
jgi:hypothetical protein